MIHISYEHAAMIVAPLILLVVFCFVWAGNLLPKLKKKEAALVIWEIKAGTIHDGVRKLEELLLRFLKADTKNIETFINTIYFFLIRRYTELAKNADTVTAAIGEDYLYSRHCEPIRKAYDLAVSVEPVRNRFYEAVKEKINDVVKQGDSSEAKELWDYLGAEAFKSFNPFKELSDDISRLKDLMHKAA